MRRCELNPFATVVTAVVTYNSAKWIEACLQSVLACDFEGHRVVMIDNASTDDTVRRVRSSYPRVEVIQNVRNVGFARACNMALALALGMRSRYCFLLNPDTVVQDGCLRRLVEVANRECEYFALSPFQLRYDGSELDPIFGRLLRESGGCGRCLTEVVPVRQIIGAAMLLRVECLGRVGGFDPLYFMYWEDVDFFRRAGYMGLKLGAVSGASVRHRHRTAEDAKSGAFNYHRYLSSYIFRLKDPSLSLMQRSARYAHCLRVDLGAVRRKINKFSLADFIRVQCFVLKNCWRIHQNACQDRVPGAMRYLAGWR